MARFHASNALFRNGTIAGLAKAVAQPEYLKKVAAEPWMRRIVPFMMVIFLTAAWTGAMIQLANDRVEAVLSARLDLENFATISAIDLQIELARAPADRMNATQNLMAAVGITALEKNRRAMMTTSNGTIVASTNRSDEGRKLDEILGRGQAVSVLADKAGVMRFTIMDGTDTLVAVRNLGEGKGQLALLQPVHATLAPWRARALSMALLALASTIIIVTMGIAFFQQSARAQQADLICDEVRRRIDVVLSSGGSGLWDWDVPRGRIFWSDSLYALIGQKRSHDFLSFADIQTWLHPDDANPFAVAAERLAANNEPVDHEFRLRHSDGRWIWIRARGQMITDTNTPHLVGIAVDITDEVAQTARRSQDDLRLRDAIETISEAFALFDPAKKLVMANTKYQKLYRLPTAMMRSGTSQTDILEVTNTSQIPVETLLHSCPDTGDRSFETRMEDGRWFQVNERTTKDGGHVSVSSDISSHKIFEQTLATNNLSLENMVTDLRKSKETLQRQTVILEDLSESHLEQKAAAESANRAKAEFLANMSHELRTPLNHIIGFAEMMEGEVFGPLGNSRYSDYSRNIGESGRYLLGVISDILDMSSLESGRIKLDRLQTSIAEIVDCLRGDITEAAHLKNVALSIETQGPLNIIGDRKALMQITSNLMDNAVKFTTEGGKAGLRAKRIGDAVHLFFEDNGGGITPEAIDKVGRPFEQSGSMIENGFKGSGLGLSIARALTELHGGTLRIRSKVGTGTIVMVRLPVTGARSMIADLTQSTGSRNAAGSNDPTGQISL